MTSLTSKDVQPIKPAQNTNLYESNPSSKMQAVLLILSFLVLGTSADRLRMKIPLSDYIWDPYPLEMLPWVEKAFQDIASSEAKMALLYHAWNIMPQHGIKMTPDSDEEAPMNSFETNDESEREILSSSISNLLKDAHQESLLQDRMGIAFDKDQRTPKTHRVSFMPGPDLEDQIAILGVRGTPGADFPNYEDIPDTSFSCADKGYIPGFYADLETGCQSFHVCWPHMKETFLCPIGTIFNQAILSCDFWYSTNCSLAPLLYDLNARVLDSVFYREETGLEPPTQDPVAFIDWTRSPKFHPMSSKTEMYPEDDKNEVRRRHVPKGGCPEESSTTDCLEQEVTTQGPPQPRQEKVRINSKFIVKPVYVIGREAWQRKLRDVQDKVVKGVILPPQVEKDGGKGEDDSEETLCEVKTTHPLVRSRLQAIVKDLVGSLEELGESAGLTVAA